jgi:two-component system, response regulator PdtaR
MAFINSRPRISPLAHGTVYQGPNSMADAPGSGSLVLVVEDDALLRMHAAEMIEEAGFKVLEADGADEAIRMLESRADIRIIFTDIDMPGSMNGLKLAHAVANRWPPIRIVATSGHFQVRDGDLPMGGRFIAKPYRATQIISALCELDGQAA